MRNPSINLGKGLMKKYSLPIFCFVFMLATLTSCGNVSVKQDYDVNYNFSTLKNFAWLVIDPGGAPPRHNTLVEERVHKIADEHLKANGFALSSKGQADFILDYHYYARDVIVDASSVGFGYGVGGRGGFSGVGLGFPMGGTSSREVETLVIDVISPVTNKLVWRGVASERLINSTPEKTSANFTRVIQAILKKFPPGGNDKK